MIPEEPNLIDENIINLPRDQRPPHVLFQDCGACGNPFKAGDHINFRGLMPICEKCRKIYLTP